LSPRDKLATTQRVVVKIGSRLLRDDLGARVAMLASEAADLRASGRDVVVVTSGAIALGIRGLGLDARPTDLPGLQAAAAVGQGHLIDEYRRAFGERDLAIGQVLLTHDDLGNRRRYLNARATFAELLRLGAVPVVNENDTVSVDEIKFGDNDRLAALVAALVGADLLVVLTDVSGLHEGDPREGAPLVPEIHDFAVARRWAGEPTSGIGTGGMRSKVEAAAIAARFGVSTVVASGREPSPVSRILAGEPLGTLFHAAVERLQARKHWIAYALKARGRIRVDDGARRALIEKNKSLLASGVRGAEGHFDAGDPVEIVGEDGVPFARGLCAFDVDELRRVAGHRGNELAALLGYPAPDVVVHRDDLVIL
jgi:glutamate 5-kinase